MNFKIKYENVLIPILSNIFKAERLFLISDKAEDCLSKKE
jgi:hypothetical protein